MELPKVIEDIVFQVFIRSGAYFFNCVSVYAPEPSEDVLAVHFAKSEAILAESVRDIDENSLK